MTEFIAIRDRGPHIYVSPSYADRREFFTRYVRRMPKDTVQQMQVLYLYGCSLLDEQDVVAIIERVSNQLDIYSIVDV